MAPYLFWEFIILIAGVWLMTILFFVYGWVLLKRQKQMIDRLFALPKQPQSDQPEKFQSDTEQADLSPRHLEISKDEPLSKYQDVSPEEMEVSFVDKSE